MRVLLFKLLLLLGYLNTYAQTADQFFYFGTKNWESVGRPLREPNGDLLMYGIYTDTLDIDPGPAKYFLYPFGIVGNFNLFLVRYDSAMHIKWAKTFGSNNSDYSGSLIKCSDGGYLLSGRGSGQLDLNFDSTGVALTPGGNHNFIARYDENFTFQWMKTFTGSLDTYGFTLDKWENILMNGSFSGTIDFDPGTSVYQLSARAEDGFILKLDASGNFKWARAIGDSKAALNDNVMKMQSDTLGNIYVAVNTFGDPDFDFGPADSTRNSWNNDAYLVKYDSLLNLQWIVQLTGEYPQKIHNLRLEENRILITGVFGGISYLHRDVPASKFTADGQNDGFIAAYSLNGNYLFAKIFDGAGFIEDYSVGIAYGHKHYYVTAKFYQEADVDPGAGQQFFNPIGPFTASYDVFLSVLDSNFNFRSAKQYGGTLENDFAYVWLDPIYPHFFVTGSFSGTASFEQFGSITSIGNDYYPDFFMLRYHACADPLIIQQPIDVPGKLAQTASISVQAKGDGLRYQWYMNGVELMNTGSKISGAQAAVLSISDLSYQDSGYFYCRIIGACNDTVYTSTARLYVGANGVDMPAPGNMARLYPNPFSGSFRLEAKHLVKLRLFTSTGLELPAPAVDANGFVDFKQYTPGVYYLELSAERETIRIKLIAIRQ